MTGKTPAIDKTSYPYISYRSIIIKDVRTGKQRN
jgi:hypothetical protein